MSIYAELIGQFVIVGHGPYSLRAGILDEVQGTTVRLLHSRNIFSWAPQPKKVGAQGVDALLTHGPAKGSRVGPSVPLCVVNDVKRVSLCTEAAKLAFESSGWTE